MVAHTIVQRESLFFPNSQILQIRKAGIKLLDQETFRHAYFQFAWGDSVNTSALFLVLTTSRHFHVMRQFMASRERSMVGFTASCFRGFDVEGLLKFAQ